MAERYWWPLEQTPELNRIFDTAAEGLSGKRVELDSVRASVADRLIVRTVKTGLPAILAKDTLPSLCHLFVGWGDALYEGRRLSSLLRNYVHLDDEGREFIFQAHPEGDFHPWQTFCYMVMGGVRADQQITGASTLKDLASNSSLIHTQAMEDLGHLLFSHTALELDDGLEFRFADPDGESSLTMNLFAMIASAMRAHHFGSFKVCRKFHLTEGLCAVSTRAGSPKELRSFAQGFFCGQMDLLILLQHVLSLAERYEELTDHEQAELQELRRLLRMGKLFENHLYYVGHLTELASFGLRFGFEMTSVQRNAAAACIDICNGLISRFAPGLARAEVLLPFSHYRRGLTLWPDAARGVATPLEAFTADFDAVEALPVDSPPHSTTAFNFVVDSDAPRDRFQQVLDEYVRACPELPQPRGGIKHFRRLSPEGWHRQMHYEFLDYGDRIGAEIHFENAELAKLLPVIREPVRELVKNFGAASDFEVYGARGSAAKLALIFEDTAAPPPHIVRAMRELMRSTQPSLDALRQAN